MLSTNKENIKKMRQRKLNNGIIKHLAKLFPNNQELGAEIRKRIVNESNREKRSNTKDRGRG